ncbi:chitin deacetylase [Phlyctochytrium planicorne]|nr:chitin deacetylase [Phlyctochytrium planicorne]
MHLNATAQDYDFSWTPYNDEAPGDATMTNTLLNGIDYSNYDNDALKCVNNVWGLTYDDGPTQFTSRVLDLLDQTGVKATFFVIGMNVKSNPQNLIRAYQSGHDIGIHTWGHKVLTTLTMDQVVAQIVDGARIIRQIIGVTPRFIRAPTGEANNQIRAAVKKLGLRMVFWQRDTLDWDLAANVATESIKNSFQSWVNAGDKQTISLQHDAFDITTNAAPTALKVLLDAGIPIGKMSDCLNEPAYGGILESYFSGNLAPVTPLQQQTDTPKPTTTTPPSLTTSTETTAAVVTANTGLPISDGKAELGATVESTAAVASATTTTTKKDLKVSKSYQPGNVRFVDFVWGLVCGIFFIA